MVPIEIVREAIALARACEIHAAKFWANNASPGIVLQTDGSLSAEAAERLRDNWERLHRGVDRAHRTAVLTNGLKVEPVGFSAEQSQFESTRRFQSEEIARLYRIPLAMVQGQISGDLESVGQEFVTYTLLPWMRRIESAISRSLIYNDDAFYAEFDTKGLMRANSNSRAGFYSTMTGLGIYSINDCRRAEGLPPIENGDKHFVGMNQQPIEEAVKPKPDPMAAMMGGGAPPPPAQGGVPSLPGVKKGEAPNPAEQGEASEKKPPLPPEGAIATWGDGRVGEVKHVMEQGTLDLKSGEKIEVEPGKPVALVVDSESGEEVGVPVSELRPAKQKAAVEEKRAESRDCGRDESGRFGSDNKCQKDAGAGEEESSEDSSPGDDDKKAKADRIAKKAIKSLDTTNGFSIHPITEGSPTSGYMVSVVKASEIVVDSKEEVTGDLISKFMEENKSEFDARPSLHVGGWIDGKTDKIYLDLSEQFDSIDDAIDAAESTDQLAIWDLNEKKEIRNEEYDGKRTRPKRQARSLRLPGRRVGRRDREGAQRSPQEDSRRARVEAAVVRSEVAVELIESARQSLGELPKVEFRNLGGAAASYVADADTIFVSPDLDEVFTEDVESGWLSQDNPILHEAAHRHHVLADFGSYISSASFQFSDEQRSLISSDVSRYAATSGREFVAEVLAGSWAGKKYGHGIRKILSQVTNGKVEL
jgi:hypothetical protein